MKNTDDPFDIRSLGTVCKNVKLANAREADDLYPAFVDAARFEKETIGLLLLAKGEPYSLEWESVDAEEVEKRLKKLHSKFKNKITFEKFKVAMRALYDSVVKAKYVDKNGKEKKIPQAVNSFYGILFSEKEVKMTSLHPNAHILREIGFLPVLIDGKELNVKLKQSVCSQVLGNLKSYEEKQAAYDKNKQEYNDLVVKNLKELPLLGALGELIYGIRQIEGYEKFDGDNFKRFLNRWRGKTTKKDENGKAVYDPAKSMHEYFKQCPKSRRFSNTDRNLFGYSGDFMNYLFENRKLWDVIDDQAYATIMIESFHWQKECINVSFNNASQILCLGANYLKYKIDRIDGNFVLSIVDPYGDKKWVNVRLGGHPAFDETAEIKPDAVGDSSYSIRYSQDSKKKTWYIGRFAEPRLRRDVASGDIYVDFPMTNHCEEGIDVKDSGKSKIFVENLHSSRWYLNSSPSLCAEKHKFEFDRFNVMGVDLGIRHPFAYAIASCSFKKGSIVIDRILKCDHSKDSSVLNEKTAIIDATTKMVEATYDFLKCVRAISSGWKKPSDYSPNLNWVKRLGFTKDSWTQFLTQIESNPETWADIFRNPESNPLYFEADKMIRHNISHLRSWHLQYSGKAKIDYCQNGNRFDQSNILLRALIKLEIARRKSYSMLGRDPSEAQPFAKGFCSSLWEWHAGLVEYFSKQLASAIINVARENKVKFVFIEDLDTQRRLFDDVNDNIIKDSLVFGQIKKRLADKARKHNISVVMVNPELTSQVDYDTKKIGYRQERDTLLVDNGLKIESVEADINAAKNVLERGIVRNANLRTFNAYKISENEVVVLAEGKKKVSSIVKHMGNTDCMLSKKKMEDGAAVLFEIGKDGELLVKNAKIGSKAKGLIEKSKAKSCQVVRSADQWFLKDEFVQSLKK